MKEPVDLPASIEALFAEPQPPLSARALDAVRQDIHRTPQRAVIGPFRASERSVAAVALVALVIVSAVILGSALGIQGPSVGQPARPSSLASNRSPSHAAASSPIASQRRSSPPAVSGPGTFSSPLYGEVVPLPAGWVVSPAVVPWDGRSEPGPYAQSDTFSLPGGRIVWVFAGPFAGGLDDLAQDRIAATQREHGTDCPDPLPAVHRPTTVGGQPAVLLGWQCGGLINEVVTIRSGVAWEFVIRDLTIPAAADAGVSAVFRSFLDSLTLPT